MARIRVWLVQNYPVVGSFAQLPVIEYPGLGLCILLPSHSQCVAAVSGFDIGIVNAC